MRHQLGKWTLRCCLLYISGNIFASFLATLKYKRSLSSWLNVSRPEISFITWDWLAMSIVYGVLAVGVGFLYPCIDRKLGQYKQYMEHDWPAVIRCFLLFVGINHAATKISFNSNHQLVLSLAVMSIGLWYFFDSSRSGLLLAVCITGLAMAFSHFVFTSGSFSGPLDPQLCSMPCIYFSASTTVGRLGRQLAKGDMLASVKSKSE